MSTETLHPWGWGAMALTTMRTPIADDERIPHEIEDHDARAGQHEGGAGVQLRVCKPQPPSLWALRKPPATAAPSATAICGCCGCKCGCNYGCGCAGVPAAPRSPPQHRPATRRRRHSTPPGHALVFPIRTHGGVHGHMPRARVCLHRTYIPKTKEGA